MQGNTCHGHGRFGFYLLGPNFPRDVASDANGQLTDSSSCAAFDGAGADRGVGYRFSDNVDYDNVFVGQYDAGDVQYARHISLSNDNLMYWKTTKGESTPSHPCTTAYLAEPCCP